MLTHLWRLLHRLTLSVMRMGNPTTRSTLGPTLSFRARDTVDDPEVAEWTNPEGC